MTRQRKHGFSAFAFTRGIIAIALCVGFLVARNFIVQFDSLSLTIVTQIATDTKSTKISNVVLMGQFNYAEDESRVLHWFQQWSSIFEHVQARGPWNNTQLKSLKLQGLDVYQGQADRGFVSPLENLSRCLTQYSSNTSVQGVLYLHDDALLDPSIFYDKENVNSIIGSTYPPFPYSYHLPESYQNQSDSPMYTFQIIPGNPLLLTNPKTNVTVTATNWKQLGLHKWWEYNRHLAGLLDLARDPMIRRYLSSLDDKNKRGLVIPSPVQADMLYVPTCYAVSFQGIAQLIVKHRVFLEVGIPLAVDLLRRQVSNVSVQIIELCTTFFRKRGTPDMIYECRRRNPEINYKMFHPLKLSIGFETWDQCFRENVLGGDTSNATISTTTS